MSLPLELQSLLVISGGSGANNLVSAFEDAQQVVYVLPLSDDGGSSSEIMRVFGGGSLGDIRSRLTRLINVKNESTHGASQLHAIKRLLEYRLPDEPEGSQTQTWRSIVEGRHWLWKGIGADRKETIRAFLVHFESAVLRKAQKNFNFQRASIGNLFLSGASMFLGSIPSAIFLFASLTNIPSRYSVLPIINTMSTVTIAAELENGEIIIGQSDISHPTVDPSSRRSSLMPLQPSLHSPESWRPHIASESSSTLLRSSFTPHSHSPQASTPIQPTRASTPLPLFEGPVIGDEEDPSDTEENENEPRKLTRPESSRNWNRNVSFTKELGSPLPARIKRIFHLNAFGFETFPKANPLFFEKIATSSSLVYCCGSLYTSIIPCLALHGVGNAIANSPALKCKILLLNGTLDRETPGYTAVDFIYAITKALNDSYENVVDVAVTQRRPNEYITHLVYLVGGKVDVETDLLEAMGITCIPVHGEGDLFDEGAVKAAFSEIFTQT